MVAGLTFTISQSAPPFTDDPLISGSTFIRGIHITELRSRVDAVRERYGLGVVTWVDPSLSGVFIKAIHITQLRDALSGVYTAAGTAAPTFTDATLVVGVTQMKVAHIAELRAAVIAIE